MLRYLALPREARVRPCRAPGLALRYGPVLGLLVLTSACAPTARLVPAPAPAGMAQAPPPAAAPAATPAPPVETMLRTEVAKWHGTPHLLGGEDRNGLDCSAFVRNVYDSLFDVRLPRTTSEQAETGRPVEDALQPGDLVFFRPAAKSRHVGIYLSAGEFAHVSSTDGVTVSRLADDYWRDAYWTSRRILAPSPPPVATAVQTPALQATPPPASPPVLAQGTPPTPRRIGW